VAVYAGAKFLPQGIEKLAEYSNTKKLTDAECTAAYDAEWQAARNTPAPTAATPTTPTTTPPTPTAQGH
jgi:hypothetical protein